MNYFGLITFFTFVFAAPSSHSIFMELERFDKELSIAEDSLASVERQLTKIKSRLATLQIDLAATKVRKNEIFKQYQERIRVLNRIPAGARLILLGGSQSLSEYLAVTRVLRWVAEHDRKLHDTYVTESNRLNELVVKLEKSEQKLEQLTQQARQKRDQVAKSRKKRLILTSKVTDKSELKLRVAKEKSVARKELSTILSRLASKKRDINFVKNQGKLPWPAVGKVMANFGQKVELAYGTTTSHNGLDIASKTGARVEAIASGKVAYANWLKGYGQVVIIDHGEHYHTLMAHLATITVSQNDMVVQGTQVGTVGDTGSLRGTVLYFEIRRNGIPVNPETWLKRRINEISKN